MGIAFITFLASIAYLVGSVPTGYLIARWRGIADIRTVGSGNIGATNVGRHLGLPFFFVILLLDSAKAYLCLYWIGSFGVPLPVVYLGALALLFGNARSLFLNFTGGKGVATGIGILAYLSPILVWYFIGFWGASFWCDRDAGIASVGAYWTIIMFVLTQIYLKSPDAASYEFVILLVVMASWITWLHRENIRYFFSNDSIPTTGPLAKIVMLFAQKPKDDIQ